jgi:hypothetical protein
MPAEGYEDMRDALIHQRAMADYRAGRIGALTLDEVQALLAAPTPLAFWRAKRGMTQAALANDTALMSPISNRASTADRSTSWLASPRRSTFRSTAWSLRTESGRRY